MCGFIRFRAYVFFFVDLRRLVVYCAVFLLLCEVARYKIGICCVRMCGEFGV